MRSETSGRNPKHPSTDAEQSSSHWTRKRKPTTITSPSSLSPFTSSPSPTAAATSTSASDTAQANTLPASDGGDTSAAFTQPNPSAQHHAAHQSDTISPSVHGSQPDESVAVSIPRSYRVNSSNRLVYDKRPSKQSKRQPSRWKQLYKKPYDFFIVGYLKLRQRLKGDTDTEIDDFVITIQLIFKNERDEEVLRHALAKLDTGNPKNLISLDLAERFGLPFKSDNGKVVLELPGGGAGWESIATVEGRWSKYKKHHPRLRFDPKFMDSEFEVSNCIERFDAVIGSETISKYRLLDTGPGLALTGFRTKPPGFKSAEVKEAEEKQKQAREENEARKRELLAKQSKASSPRKDSSAEDKA